MLGIRFSALSTAEYWSLVDSPLGRVSVHSAEAQWLHLRRVSSVSSSTRLNGSPSRSVMTCPHCGHAPTSQQLNLPAAGDEEHHAVDMSQPRHRDLPGGVGRLGLQVPRSVQAGISGDALQHTAVVLPIGA